MSHYLNDEEKKSILESRLRSFAVDAYGHELNLQVAISNNDDEAILASNEALNTIAVATATYQQELAIVDSIIQENSPTSESVYMEEIVADPIDQLEF